MFDFIVDGIESLENFKANSLDGVILSNMMDNLYPKGVELLLTECYRLLKNNRRILINLNPNLIEKEIKEMNIKVMGENLLDSRFVL
ncbi:class I SAM-dependent methyltransferase [Miniphocaeibacter halophilus]|uniref:Methyltransferase domain-containing protein n=1 Tax=Miniphocaeibacter halophilus TaxID=2931922 RepID=A0AC61MVE7_9FIRM|nr:methyltransferase domain-containing protein [Miniphocaeibacter halophilus]